MTCPHPRVSAASSIFMSMLFALSGILVPMAPASAASLCDVKIATHTVAPSKSPCLSAPVTDCASAAFVTSSPASGFYDVYLLISTSGELGGAKFGIDYDGAVFSGVDINDWTACGPGDQLSDYGQATVPHWPDAGSGLAVIWPGPDCQTASDMTVIGAFSVSIYGPDVLDIVGHPADGQISVADCGSDPSGLVGRITECVLPLSAGGAAGFGLSGKDPCPPPTDTDGDGLSDADEGNTDPALLTFGGFNVSSTQNFTCAASWSVSNGEMPGASDDLPSTMSPPTPADFPCGVYSFAVTSTGPGMATTVDIDFSGCGTTPTTYWKYGPTPADPTLHWYDFTGLDPKSLTGATFSGNTVTLHLYDGRRGDDDLLENGVTFDIGGPGMSSLVGATPPRDGGGLSLVQNSPNPFDGSTLFAYRIEVEAVVTLRVFDVNGREVARPFHGRVVPGKHEVSWDGRDAQGRIVPAGIYFYKLETPLGTRSRKMVVR